MSFPTYLKPGKHRRDKEDIIMSTLTRAALIALTLVSVAATTEASAAKARPAHTSQWVDKSDPYGGYDPNSAKGNRALWDYHSRHGN